MKCFFTLAVMMICSLCVPLLIKAQKPAFSAWSVDPGTKSLRTRYLQFKATDGNSYIQMEIQNSFSCSLSITSNVCGADIKGINGWKKVTIRNGETKTVYFRILNSCNNGWWWWFKDFKDLRATF